MRTRRVLVTGATGFVGAVVARRLLERGHDVRALVRADYRRWRLQDLSGTIGVHVADFLDSAGLAALFSELRPEWVVHLAAYGGYETQRNVSACVRTNVEATVRLIDVASAHGVRRFINTGSSSEYGIKDHAPHEDEPVEPNSLYAVTKSAGTAYARHIGRTGALHTTTLRLYSVYGPFEEPTRLVPTMIVFGLAGTYPPLVQPTTARDFVYVGDVATAYETALEADLSPGAVYNIGSGKQTTLQDVVDVSRATFSIKEAPSWGTMPQRLWDTTVWVANTSRTRAELGWTASTTFGEGFRRTAAWVSEPSERRLHYERSRMPPV
ncbi:MAG: NAD-dependent epimerase/dehydratase family protein [Candidatus Eremiobacteraeota bacterium]|nr:NAD-dependent epimerase/dehydratase family protein [Candidatus Eremiobacteraeota bacterium]